MALLFAFAPEGACQAAVSPRRWWSLTPPFQLFSYPPRRAVGVFFSAALSVGSPRQAVSLLPALWSPDFPHCHRSWANPARRPRDRLVHFAQPCYHTNAAAGAGRIDSPPTLIIAVVGNCQQMSACEKGTSCVGVRRAWVYSARGCAPSRRLAAGNETSHYACVAAESTQFRRFQGVPRVETSSFACIPLACTHFRMFPVFPRQETSQYAYKSAGSTQIRMFSAVTRAETSGCA